jgi:DNA invertase Pin-like site-specific DNA recombinase
MNKRAVIYARVSKEEQNTGNNVSIDQQFADMRALCERNGWAITGEFVDAEKYKATQAPNKGNIVNPSGERADRPGFLEMLAMVKTGEPDIILCWRDDRLVRHPRVAVVLEDTLDIGDVARRGAPKIEIRDATGAVIDRFTLSIKAAIWREENKRRTERTRMGKAATLKQGRWPNNYQRFGYVSYREEGKRGRTVEIAEGEAEIVLTIHKMYDAGIGIQDIRRHLINNEMEQRGPHKHKWSPAIIYFILRAEDYAGVATWTFADGMAMSIKIPVIVPRPLWERNQARLERNKGLSTRNAKGVYLLQGLVRCGDCGWRMTARRKKDKHIYFCAAASRYPDEAHPKPYNRNGGQLDWLVWRAIVDYGIRQPDTIREQVSIRQAELLEQDNAVDGDIARIRHRLAEIEQERAHYSRQEARGKITEKEFDCRMDETRERHLYWQSELDRLLELRDNAVKVQAGLDYATELLTVLRGRLSEIDIPPDELRELPDDRRAKILEKQRTIIRALCDRVTVYASGKVVIDGVLDGSEAAQFELATSTPG